MNKAQNPEQFHARLTAEGEQFGEGIPPCPSSIRGRQARFLWAQSAAILSARRPMTPAKLRALEKAILANESGPLPSPSQIARRARTLAGEN